MLSRIIITFAIYFLVQLPLSLIAWPCVAIALLTKWDGTTYYFGNTKYPRSKVATHYAAPTGGAYWKDLVWYAWRNPVYNLNAHIICAKMRQPYLVAGNEEIGNAVAPGFYDIIMWGFWEYYWIKTYKVFGSKRCIRVRLGWKISKNSGDTAEYVCSINPWKKYTGI